MPSENGDEDRKKMRGVEGLKSLGCNEKVVQPKKGRGVWVCRVYCIEELCCSHMAV